MQLQINTTGAWRKVCEFPPSELALARFAGSMLSCVARDAKAKFAIVDDQGNRYYYQPASTDSSWRTTRGIELTEVA